jgi:hypothetical protein
MQVQEITREKSFLFTEAKLLTSPTLFLHSLRRNGQAPPAELETVKAFQFE